MIAALLVACTPGSTAPNPLAYIDRSIDRTAHRGIVTERLGAGGYTYVRVGVDWFVVMGATPAPTHPIRLSPIGRATDFYSGRLDRTFASVTFAVVHQP